VAHFYSAVDSERRAAGGLAANGNLVEVFASASGSWTIIATRPSGVACIVGSGEAFHLAPPAPVTEEPEA
jgi:hypothetical protein